MVIAIIMVIAGIVAFLGLPVAQYPNIIPPEIQVNTTYLRNRDINASQHIIIKMR